MAGLRERRKQQTYATLSAAAGRLFAEHGFDHVTIADIADAAGVAKMTVTNYFPRKEDLVFDRHPQMASAPAQAAAARPPGTTISACLHQAYLAGLDRRDPTLGFVGVEFARVVAASPALRAREREIFDQTEAALAAEIARQTAAAADDVGPRIAAAHLAGALRVLYHEGRRRLLAGEPTPVTADALRRSADLAFALAEHGIGAATGSG